MSKITAEIEIKQGRIADISKGVASKINSALLPLKRAQVGISSIGAALAPVAGIAMGVGTAIAAAGVAVVGAAGGIAVGVRSAMNLGGALSDLEARTGVTAGKLMVMQQAFTNAGVSAEMVGPAINRMQKALAGANEDGDSTVSMFEQLGLNLAELKSLKPDEQFQRTAKAIAGLTSPADRAAAAVGLFGKSGGELLALFNDSAAFGEASIQLGKQAAIMDRNTALFDGISDKLALAGLKVQGFFVGVADQVAPVIKPLLDWFASQDLAAQGIAFGRGIAIGIEILKGGMSGVGEAIRAAFDYGLESVANTLIAGVESAINAMLDGRFQAGLSDVFSRVAAEFASMTTQGIIDSLAKVSPLFGMLKMASKLEGGGVSSEGGAFKVELPRINTASSAAAMGSTFGAAAARVDAARAAADGVAETIRASIGGGAGLLPGGDKNAGGLRGGVPDISRQFATSAGVFLKNPLAAKQQGEMAPTNSILEKIRGELVALRNGKPVIDGKVGVMKFA